MQHLPVIIAPAESIIGAGELRSFGTNHGASDIVPTEPYQTPPSAATWRRNPDANPEPQP